MNATGAWKALSGPLALPEDRALSPYTGWTRAHWEAAAHQLLTTARHYGTESHARVQFPGGPGGYGHDVDGLEGFARTLLTAGFWAAGNKGADPHGHLEWYAQGFATGPDPHHPERWVRMSEHDQAKVEAASLSLVLHLTRPYLWDRLSPLAQEMTVEYLQDWIGASYPPNNWVWFQIVTEQFLKNVGGAYCAEDIEKGLAFHETMYVGDGWYHDGPERNYDNYVGWALHLYPLLWCDMAGTDFGADKLRPIYQERLDKYLADAIQLVGADGGPLFEGRSLIYRFATVAPLWMGAYTGSPTLTPGQIRRAASGTLQHFARHGAPNDDGVLTMGWYDEFKPMAQSYSGPGSPYWASKGMLGLALPADHPVWTAPEEPLPLERGNSLTTVAHPGWIVSGTQADGIVRVLNHGTDHAAPGDLRGDAALYTRMGYSTRTAPVMVPATGVDPIDNTVALLNDAGRPSSRTGLQTLLLEQRPVSDGVGNFALAFSRSRAHWVSPDLNVRNHGGPVEGTAALGPWLVSGSVVRGQWEVRLGLVQQAPADPVPDADVPPAAAVPDADVPPAAAATPGVLRIAGWPIAYDGHGETLGSTVSGRGERSEVLDASGLPVEGVEWLAGVSPLGESTAVPWRSTNGPAVVGHWYAALVRLAGVGGDEQAPQVSFGSSGAFSVMAVTWGDGAWCSIDLAQVVTPA